MGLGRMLEKGGTLKDLAHAYIQDNLKELVGILQSAVQRWLLKALTASQDDPVDEHALSYEDKVDYQSHDYEFFYNLETLL